MEKNPKSPEQGVEKKTPQSDASSRRNMRSESLNDAEGAGLKELFVAQLKDIYWAEKALTKALPKMAAKATSSELVDALNAHLTETEEHVARLEKVFETIGEKAEGKPCDAMKGLLEEADHVVAEMPDGRVRDAAIIISAQKVEHYEIASYGSLRAFADALGESEAADLLEQTLEEEKEADQALSEIALTSINPSAAGAADRSSGTGKRNTNGGANAKGTGRKNSSSEESYEEYEEEDDEPIGEIKSTRRPTAQGATESPDDKNSGL